MLRNVSSSSCRSLLMAAASVAALSCFSSVPALACDNWQGGNGNWYGSNGWDGGDPNSSGVDVCIQTANSTVDLNGSAAIGDLTLGSTDTLDIGGTLRVFGSSIDNGHLISLPNTTLTVSGSSVTLTGGGIVQMSGDAFFNQSSGGQTLFNFDNTIEGTGQLGQNGLALGNEAGGTVNANVSGGTLTLNGGGTVTNAGLLEATNGGILQISNTVNNAGGNITADGGTVDINATINGGTLNATGANLMQNDGTTVLNGVTLSTGSTYKAAGQNYLEGTITNNGTITVPNGNLTVAGSTVTLTGGGTVQMSSDAFFNQASGGLTLFNVNNLIEGTGQLGQNGLTFSNEAKGVVDANVNGGTLTLNGGGNIANAGLLEATNSGILTIDNNVTNTGANITADGGTVNLQNSMTLTGGTLNVINSGTMNSGVATLSGVTLSTKSTLNDVNNTFLVDSFTNQGTVLVPNTNLTVDSATLTLNGGGTIKMSNDAFFNQASSGLVLDNIDNLIEGSGQLGQNGLQVKNESAGVIDANVNGTTLTLNGGGAVTNLGLIEATNGGTLTIDNNVTNTSSNITADGGTVNLQNSMTLTSGTLNVINGGVMNSGVAFLKGVTLSSGSTLNDVNNTFLVDSFTNQGTVLIPNTNLTVDSATLTLNGGGTIKMSSDAFFNQASGGLVLDNIDNLIEGSGQLGQNGLQVKNESAGVIDANVNGTTLTLNGGGLITNLGLIEATNGGILTIDNNVTNTGANITADGGTVNLQNSMTLTGGTLNTLNGGVMNSGVAFLNGVTLSTGSTLNDVNTTLLVGSFTNEGTVLVPNTTLTVDSATLTLNGGGTIEMSSDAFFNQASGGLTLDNVNNTIEGTGQFGQNGLSIINEIGGTILANVSGGTLFLNGGGTVTNDGTFQANVGSLLHVANVNFTNFGSATLTGGTYNIYGSSTTNGTIQVDGFGTGGGEIVNNDATIYLNGALSNLVDARGLDALSNFANNETSGSFTITNGRNFTSPGDFANAGIVNVGATSTFNTGLNSGNNYNQSVGTTTVDGRLQAASVNIGNSSNPSQNGGTLQGTGTVAANLFDYGTVRPGDAGSAGTLTVTGNFTMGAQGALEIDIGPSGNSQLDVLGHTTLAGTLAVILLDSFHFAKGETFDIVNTDPFSGDFSHLSLDGVGCTSRGTDSWNCSNLSNGLYLTEEFLSNNSQLWLQVNGQVTHGVPEPGPLLPLGSAFGALAAAAWLRRKKAGLG